MPTDEITTNGGESIVGGVQSFLSELGQALPEILAALLVLIVGAMLAGLLGSVVRRLVIWSRVDSLLARSRAGAGTSMNPEQMKFRIADAAGMLVKWFVILLAIAIAADILQWDQLTALINSLAAYLPNVAAAILLLVGGYLLGNFVGSLVSQMGTFGRAGESFGNAARVSIYVLAVMAALIQLGIAESIIHIAFIGLVSMVALAGGLAFGLGGRDRARDLLTNMGPRVAQQM